MAVSCSCMLPLLAIALALGSCPRVSALRLLAQAGRHEVVEGISKPSDDLEYSPRCAAAEDV